MEASLRQGPIRADSYAEVEGRMWEPSLLPPLRQHTAVLYRQQDGEPAAFINRRRQEGAAERKGPPVAEISRSCQRSGQLWPSRWPRRQGEGVAVPPASHLCALSSHWYASGSG